jgi:hypothetical protein
MTNPLRFTASRLAACGLILCLSTAGAAALGQTTPETFDSSAQTSASQIGPVDRGSRVYRPCTRVFDGRGEKVLAGQTDGAAGRTAADCRAPRAPPPPMETDKEVKPPEPERQVKPPANTHPKVVAVPPPAPAITAGHTVADPSENEAATPIAPHISAGRLSATLVTGGTAVFLLQSGLWTYLLLLGLPLWKHVDLLPIVDTVAHESDAAVDDADGTGEDTAVTDVLDARSKPRDDAGNKA